MASHEGGRILFLLLVTCNLLLVSCGFHLRGAGEYRLSPALATLRVVVEGSALQNDPLRAQMIEALRAQAGAEVVEATGVPTLTFFGERFSSRLLSVTSTGQANEYSLDYELSFRVADKDGRPLAPPQTVRVQRNQTFDRLNVLASEREEGELRREMQRDAVQQVLRRLAKIK
jgi:LPS-assembly lipoprotein